MSVLLIVFLPSFNESHGLLPLKPGSLFVKTWEYSPLLSIHEAGSTRKPRFFAASDPLFNSYLRMFLSRPMYMLTHSEDPMSGDERPITINSITGQRLSYSEFVRRSKTLATYLQSIIGLNKGDAAYVRDQSHSSSGVVLCSAFTQGSRLSCQSNQHQSRSRPANQTVQARDRLCHLNRCSQDSKLRHGTTVIDSVEFELMTTSPGREMVGVKVSRSDVAGIMYSSGTIGNVKGVLVTHRNLIAMTGSTKQRKVNSLVVMLQIVPYFHVYGFHYIFKCIARNETMVIMEKYDLEKLIDAVEKTAKVAWDMGKKLWVDLQSGKIQTDINKNGDAQPELCAYSIALSRSEFLKQRKIMVLPCGLTLGSHLTVVGKPRSALPEHDPKISLLRDGDESMMVLQFMLEL